VNDNKLELLDVIVEAHEKAHPRIGLRELLMFIRSFGGGGIKHHAVQSGELDGLDEAMLEDMHSRDSSTSTIASTTQTSGLPSEHARSSNSPSASLISNRPRLSISSPKPPEHR
jgi:hypothetical protein